MQKHRHFILNKPLGVVSQFVPLTKRKKPVLGDVYDFPDGTMAIGRLDVKSEGLLLLTTNGKVSAEVRSKGIEKEYYVQVDGIITQAAIEEMQIGVEIGFSGIKYMTIPCKAFILETPPDFPPRAVKIRDAIHGPTSWASIIITEGKFKQVRKMTAAVGFPTLRLVRVRIGNLKMGFLQAGEVIEVDDLLELVK